MALNIRVTSPLEPFVTVDNPVSLFITDNLDGTWQVTNVNQVDNIHFPSTHAGNLAITKIEFFEDDLLFLKKSFQHLTGLTEFIVQPDTFENVTSGILAFGVYETEAPWLGCSSLISFPAMNLSGITFFGYFWSGCTSLESFGMVDTSNGTNFMHAWGECSSLTDFSRIDTSSGEEFILTWENCTSLTSFPAIDLSSANILEATWFRCTSLISFPAIDTSSVTDFTAAWADCISLECMGGVDTTSAVDTVDMFDGSPLIRPSAAERALIEQTPGINWVSDAVPGDHCYMAPAPVGGPTWMLGSLSLSKVYLGSNQILDFKVGNL